MKVQKFIVGLLATNCYVLSDISKDAIIIDPGFETKREFQGIEEYINQNSLKLKVIVNTHGHSDHTSGNKAILEKFDCSICIHKNDLEHLNHSIDISKIIVLKDGDLIEINKKNLRVISTPGHTPGGICLLGKNILFSGDTLFYRGIGRMDFPGGSRVDMKEALLKLMSLPDNLIVYPGHGISTTIGDEKKLNSFLCWL